MKNLVVGCAALVSIAGLSMVASVPAMAEDVKAVKTVAPEYPRGAERRKIEGYVVLEYTVNPTGDVSDVKVVEASPEGIFEDAATQAVTQWKFENPASAINKQTKVSFKL